MKIFAVASVEIFIIIALLVVLRSLKNIPSEWSSSEVMKKDGSSGIRSGNGGFSRNFLIGTEKLILFLNVNHASWVVKMFYQYWSMLKDINASLEKTIEHNAAYRIYKCVT